MSKIFVFPIGFYFYFYFLVYDVLDTGGYATDYFFSALFGWLFG
jgi:hypothetical protein